MVYVINAVSVYFIIKPARFKQKTERYGLRKLAMHESASSTVKRI